MGAWEGLRGLRPMPEDLCLRCLEDEYDLLRRAAMESLAEVGDEHAIPALLEVARHDLHQDKGGGFFLRRIAVDAMKQIGQRTGKAIDLPAEETRKPAPRPGLEMLSQAARCTNAGIRHDAISRLGWSDEKLALDLLLDLLKSDPVPANRAAAISSLRELLAKPYDAAKGLPWTQAERESVFNAILDLVRHEDPTLSSPALAEISVIAGEYLPKYQRFPELFALALDAVEDTDRLRQSAGLTVLRFVGSAHPEALKQHLTPERRVRLLARLQAGMEDREVGYRIRFIEMLGYLRKRSVVPRLIELLNHVDATVRSFAILALGHIGDPRALPGLERGASDRRGHQSARGTRSAGICPTSHSTDSVRATAGRVIGCRDPGLDLLPPQFARRTPRVSVFPGLPPLPPGRHARGRADRRAVAPRQPA